MPNFDPLPKLRSEEVLQLQQLVAHPAFSIFNKLLLHQVDLATEDFLSRDLTDPDEIVQRYKDLRGVHKAVGETLKMIGMLQGQPTVAMEGEQQAIPSYFPNYPADAPKTGIEE